MSENNHTRRPREIEADLDRTRTQLGHTLDRLEHKLSPGELFDQAFSYARANGGGEFVSNFKDAIVRNPLPVALIGLGFAWLMTSGRRGSVPGEYGYESHMPDSTEGVEGALPVPTITRDEQREMAPGDDVTTALDEPTATRDETDFGAYDGKSGVVVPGDRVAKGLDETSPKIDHGTSATQTNTNVRHL